MFDQARRLLRGSDCADAADGWCGLMAPYFVGALVLR